MTDVAKRIIVIPDAHAHPKYDNNRFSALGRFIARSRPSHVVCLGDWFDMPSLSQWDRGKVQFQGRRYTDDIDAGRDAHSKLHTAFAAETGKQRINRKGATDPFWDFIKGNHCHRVDRALASDPHLAGAISPSHTDLPGWRTTEYKDRLTLGGVLFTHSFFTANGREIGGKAHARMLLSNHVSCVVGHSHRRDFAEDPRPDGSRIFAVVAGCYTHHDYVEDWNRGTKHYEWHGITVLDNVRNGQAESISFVDQTVIEREFG